MARGTLKLQQPGSVAAAKKTSNREQESQKKKWKDPADSVVGVPIVYGVGSGFFYAAAYQGNHSLCLCCPRSLREMALDMVFT